MVGIGNADATRIIALAWCDARLGIRIPDRTISRVAATKRSRSLSGDEPQQFILLHPDRCTCCSPCRWHRGGYVGGDGQSVVASDGVETDSDRFRRVVLARYGRVVDIIYVIVHIH